MKDWKKSRPEKTQRRILKALAENVNFNDGSYALGYPVSRLDGKVFHDAPFLKDAPLLMAYVANPNHIGCIVHITNIFRKGHLLIALSV